MRPNPTYSPCLPQTSQIPAESLRADPRDTRRFLARIAEPVSTPNSTFLIPNWIRHPDHLGSSSWITYTDGSAVQHLHYLPWGEDFVRQRSTDWHAMYTFSAKEKDAETGYSYFGARYYSSDLSIWLSVDPMSDSIPYMTPYNYCKNSPILMKDPNGEFPWLAVWGVIEVGLAIYDAYQTGATIIDKNASLGEKIAAGFGFVVGAALPGGGYGTVSKKVAGEAAKQFERISTKLIPNSKGQMLATKLMKKTSTGKIPTPQTDINQFEKIKGTNDYKHKDTGAIYKKSYTQHKGKDGEYKIYPKGTTNFGEASNLNYSY